MLHLKDCGVHSLLRYPFTSGVLILANVEIREKISYFLAFKGDTWHMKGERILFACAATR